MKIFTYICMVCLMAFIGTATTKAQTNLLSNPGFEEVDEDGYINIWTTNTQDATKAIFTRINTDKYSGDYSAQLQHIAGVGGATISQTVPVTAGLIYNYSFAYKSLANWTTATGSYIQVTIANTGYTGIYEIITTYTLNEWKKYSFNFKADVGTTTASIKIKVYRFTSVLIDDASISISLADKQDQTISGISAMTNKVGDEAYQLYGAASSGLAVTYSSSNTAVATISGAFVTIVGAGTSTITASQAGNSSYTAKDYSVKLTVNEATATQSQTISGLSNITKTAGDAAFDLSATATSGLDVTYASTNTAVATISGKTVTIVGAGTATIIASQGGNSTYTAATDVTATLTVSNITTKTSVINGSIATLCVSPNPVIDNTTTATFAEAGDNAIIRIVSLTGKTVLQQPVTKGSTQANIDVSNFAKGIYLVNYSDDKVKNNTVKLIK